MIRFGSVELGTLFFVIIYYIIGNILLQFSGPGIGVAFWFLCLLSLKIIPPLFDMNFYDNILRIRSGERIFDRFSDKSIDTTETGLNKRNGS